MVSGRLRSFSIAAALLLALTSAPARDYQVGDEAVEDIQAVAPLVVVDRETTELLKRNEALGVPAIFRFYPHAVNEVEAAFHSTFVCTRENFLDALEDRFGSRQLDVEQTSEEDFSRFVNDFQKQNILFPTSRNLARIWAKGESDEAVETQLIGRLQKAMKEYIRPDSGTDEVLIGPMIRLIALGDNEIVTRQLVEERGFDFPKTNLVSALRAKRDLLETFPIEDRSIGKYVASFIKPNCTLEAALTRTLQHERTAEILVVDRYSAGDVIVRRGEVIDQKIKAALDQLHSKTSDELTQRSINRSAPFTNVRHQWTWIIAFAAAMFLICGLVWRVARRRTERALALALPAQGDVEVRAGNELSSEGKWQQRALAAENQAGVQAAMRSGLMTQLAQWMSDKLTRSLISQRAQLVDAQQIAAAEMMEFEARLEKIQGPLQERLLAYEKRIAELERELALKGQENQELLKARIHVARRQLELEREKDRPEFN